MNRGAIFGGLAVASLLLACGSTEVDLGTRPQFTEGGNVLTVLAFDGVTGQPVNGAALTVRVGSHVLTAQGASNSNAYVVSNLPDGGWPIFATATGYLPFAGVVALASGNTTPANPAYTTQVLVMYSAQQVTTPYTIKVYDSTDGSAVTGGEVIITLSANPSTSVSAVIDAFTTPVGGTASIALIQGSYGFRPATGGGAPYPLTAGVATIPAADLVYGATYTVDVVGATNAGGDYLSQNFTGTPDTIQAPNEFPIKAIFMGAIAQLPQVLTFNTDLVSGVKPVSTPATAPTAPLTITFAQPVEDCTSAADHDFFTDSGGLKKLPVVTTGTTKNVTMTIAGDGLSLTVIVPAASFNTVPAATAAETIYYNTTVAYDPAHPLLPAGLTAGQLKVRVKNTTGGANCVPLQMLKVRGARDVTVSGVTTYGPAVDPAVIAFPAP